MRTTTFPLLAAALVTLSHAGCPANPPTGVEVPPREPATLTSARGAESPTLKARMHDHEAHGAAMRDAVARADLDGALREAKFLSELRVEGSIDPRLRKQLEAMNVAAARVAESMELIEASRGLANVARTCGDCHALGGPGVVVGEPPEDASVGSRMQRHRWAVGRLWDGLVVPSDHAWRAGARVLRDAPLEPELLTPGKSPVPAIGTLAASVHDLGNRATVAKAAVDRAAIYGELMSTCAACHSRLGGGPPAKAGR